MNQRLSSVFISSDICLGLRVPGTDVLSLLHAQTFWWFPYQLITHILWWRPIGSSRPRGQAVDGRKWRLTMDWAETEVPVGHDNQEIRVSSKDESGLDTPSYSCGNLNGNSKATYQPNKEFAEVNYSMLKHCLNALYFMRQRNKHVSIFRFLSLKF